MSGDGSYFFLLLFELKFSSVQSHGRLQVSEIVEKEMRFRVVVVAAGVVLTGSGRLTRSFFASGAE